MFAKRIFLLLPRHPLDLSMPCAFESSSHIVPDVSRTRSENYVLFLPSLACAGRLVLPNNYTLRLKTLSPFYHGWMSRTGLRQPPVSNTKKRNNATIVMVAGGGQWDTADRSPPLKMFIDHTCKRVTARDSDSLENKKSVLVCSNTSL